MEPSLADQIRAVKREISMRERVYPKWVRDSKMSQSEADYQIEVMRAVEKTLLALSEVGNETV